MLKIVSDGTVQGTRVFTEDGKDLTEGMSIARVEWNCEAPGRLSLTCSRRIEEENRLAAADRSFAAADALRIAAAEALMKREFKRKAALRMRKFKRSAALMMHNFTGAYFGRCRICGVRYRFHKRGA